MRLIIVLLLTGFMALFALPGAGMAHGTVGETSMNGHAVPCPECPESIAGEMGPHDCAHMASCAGPVLQTQALTLPIVQKEAPCHMMPPPHRLSSTFRQIDLPPPRLRA
ncbi:hypothetical protein [Donghicola sp.]|jgi:hypothetical protein|uniref:hypothetical protein n=1 Tax=Donghicola sp. TaxID=1929294 RepID=UPI0025F6644B|nr:hypothetical protein [Donghicola sp.]MCT4577087.1 hypothetical protein [Donghicola sp.]